jgi:hypothetical protein
MRIVAVVLARCLLFLFLFVIDARAQGAGASAATADSRGDDVPVLRPAIREVAIENLGDDGVIVVFSRRSERKPFHHASRLPPGGKAVVPVPDLPSLRASILRRNEVRRAARKDGRGGGKDATQRNLLLLGAIAGAKRGNGNRNKNGNNDNRAAPPRDDRYGQQGGNPSQYGNDDDHQFDDYGQQGSGRTERETANINEGTYHVLLGNMLGNTVGDSKGNGPRQPAGNDDPPGEIEAIDADEGPGVRVVNGVAITVATGDAEGVEEDPGIAGAGTLVAIGNDPAPVVAAAPPDPAPTCYCGPDMTVAYVEALRRARDRIEALPDRDTGPWDAAWWMSNNGSSIDQIVRPARKPGQAGKVGAEMLCPSGPCADLPGAGDGTMRLFGVCLPKHVGNDIMYGLVTHLLGFPSVAQAWGGHWAQYNSTYSSWDPPQSRAAYAIGSAIAGLEGDDLTVDNAAERFRSAEMLLMGPDAFNPIIAITSPSGSPVQYMKAVERIQLAYPALADCQHCPADATEPGTLLRDWSRSAWNSNDGSKAYPPGWKPEDEPPAGVEGE